jgi:hypothetical protein
VTGQSPLPDPRRWLALGTAFFMVTRTDDLLAGGDQSVDPAFAMTEGFQTAFLVASGIALLGVLLALLLFGRRDEAVDSVIEATRAVTPCPGHASAVPAVEAAIVGTQE